LETFIQAAETSSLTAAAMALGLPQAAVNQRISALEKVLGKSVFCRQGEHVLLTEIGQSLYPVVKRVLQLQQEARHAIAGKKVLVPDELALSASSVPGEHHLPTMLAAFRKKHPHIQIRAGVTNTSAVLEQIEYGLAELGLVGGKTNNRQLTFRFFARDRLV